MENIPKDLIFFNIHLTRKEIKKKLKEINIWGQRTIPPSGCFSKEWLLDLLVKIDKLWYNSKLISSIHEHYPGGISISLDTDSKETSAYIYEDDDVMYLHINRDLFYKLFKAKKLKNIGYHAGGIICKTRFDCILQIILHESVHMLLSLYDKLGYRKDFDPHDTEFQKLTDILFAHENHKHGLIPGGKYSQQHSIKELKSEIKNNMKVEFYNVEDWDNGDWLKGTVTKIDGDSYIIKTNSGQYQSVDIGLIRPIVKRK